MSKNRLFIIPAFVLILALLACNASSNTPSSSPDAAGTTVALTVAAQAVIPVSGSTATDTPVPASPAPPTPTTVPSATTVCDSGKFISETIPDGTTENPGASFTKTWRLKNVGGCTWTSSYAVVFDSGATLNAAASVPLSGNVAPGQEVDISVPMQAPTTPGTYTGNWKLRNDSGVLFGLGASNGDFWVKINVPAPTATATSSGGPTGPILHIPVGPILPLLLPSTQQVLTQVSAPAGGVGHAVVSCPSGTVVTGGGFAANSSLLVYSTFASGNGWEVDALNTSGSSQLLNSYAICLSNTSGASQQVYAQVIASGGSNGHAVVSCPSGTVVTGGGFASNSNLLVFNTSLSGNGWQVYAQNTSGSGQPLNAYAICLSGISGSSSQQVYTQATAPNGGTGHAVTACPSGTYLTAGGYATGGSLPVYSDSATGSSWEVDMQNNTGASQLLNSYAMCLTLP
ncbi:MAG TPA: NBR1-Ig-like domain-containing protein [Anaerolineales bacterium]|nr:NBR1-Ig-like domain-containing protein [Anaerolineales bacterium]